MAHTTTQTRHVCRRTPSLCCGVEGGMPASCMCGCGCACVPQPAASPALHPVRVCAHICVLIFLEAHGCPFSLSLSFFFFHHHHVEERESKEEGSRAAMQSRHAEGSRAGSEMTISKLAVRWHAMCCMLMQSTRSTTLVRHLSHLDILSISSSQHFPSLSHDATPQRRR